VHQHDPDAVDRCGTEGEFWTSRDADGGIHGSRILTVDPLDVPAIRFEPRADVLCKRNVRRGGTRASCRRTFYIPDETLRHFRHAVERGAELEAAWRHRIDAYGVTHPDMAGQVRAHAGWGASGRLGDDTAGLHAGLGRDGDIEERGRPFRNEPRAFIMKG
jgi:hypothetical protein